MSYFDPDSEAAIAEKERRAKELGCTLAVYDYELFCVLTELHDLEAPMIKIRYPEIGIVVRVRDEDWRAARALAACRGSL